MTRYASDRHYLAVELDADGALIRPPGAAAGGVRTVPGRTCSAAAAVCGCAGDLAAAPTFVAGTQAAVPWGGIVCAAAADIGPAPRPW